MKPKTHVLVSIGAAVAANCQNCFGHFLERAQALGVELADIREAVNLGHQMKQGAQIGMRGFITQLLGEAAEDRGAGTGEGDSKGCAPQRCNC